MKIKVSITGRVSIVLMAACIFLFNAQAQAQELNWKDYFSWNEANVITKLSRDDIKNRLKKGIGDWRHIISGRNINNNSLDGDKIRNGAIGTKQLKNGAVTLKKLNSNNCSDGQILKFNGSGWECAVDEGGESFSAAVTIEQFGGDPTGTNDSTAALNAAIASGAKVISGAGGLYNINAAINIPSNVEMRDMQLYDPNYRTNHHRFLVADTVSNIKLSNITILGDNANYAVTEDGFTDGSDGFSNGTGIFFRTVTNAKVENIRCQYMWEGMVISWLSRNVYVDGFESRQVEGYSETGLMIIASYNCHAKHVRIYNGSDGALYIYNGTDNTIEDSYVEATNPTAFNLTGTGVETCSNCFIKGTTVKGAWVGAWVGEAASRAGIQDSTFEGCHVGIAVGPFGYGRAGVDVDISRNHITGMTDLDNNYQISGILIYSGDDDYYTSPSIKVDGNYVGKSWKGMPFYVYLPPGKEMTELSVTNNIFEAATFVHHDWATQETNEHYSTNDKVAHVEGVFGATFSGNTFVTRAENQVHPNYELEFVRSKKIAFVGNHIRYGGFNNFMSASSDCEDFQITQNSFEDAPAGGYRPFYLQGTNMQAKDNAGWDDIQVAQSNTAIDMGYYHQVGYNGIRYIGPADSGIAINLPAGTLGDEYSFQNSAGAGASMFLVPQETEKIRGYDAGVWMTLPVGTTAVVRWTEANMWEVTSNASLNGDLDPLWASENPQVVYDNSSDHAIVLEDPTDIDQRVYRIHVVCDVDPTIELAVAIRICDTGVGLQNCTTLKAITTENGVADVTSDFDVPLVGKNQKIIAQFADPDDAIKNVTIKVWRH